MIKMILLLRRKPEMSFEDFRDYYENHHVPLASSFDMPLVRYRRSYVTGQVAGEPDCDCVTEVWYDLDGTWSEHRDSIVSADMAKTIAEDEARFLDRASMRIMMVEETESEPAALPASLRASS